ncbi:hypothetical protein DFA_02585 [Cavenderia fasciculata]|uniref:t-SNARE coiled-coil homology domain-containing protein n=1 Tax=Cavenderia fasciculata TaxID=261658 RepID=F4PZT2_CACFS|nr:uncharacterized protein DFA_02585 [Cavenderia fasciculata]EGG18846.1 hypothetical protein DFA_02585 [Cavenderia fasciculata]|eukprot:XP_004357308.1 hypothetical protein DFA_02585 [Cavenderia fasciculata]
MSKQPKQQRQIGSTVPQTDAKKEYNDTIKECKRIQEQDLKSLDCILVDIVEINRLGRETLEKMAQQNHQLHRVSTKIEQAEDNVDKADKLITRLSRRLRSILK